ncbi:hypothetical protein FisN_14Hh231 [Fistulifera solaris]|uniref:EF-hand domain-containing protein n=1 Tax=Fistulifera solaris TaxID=1519565 RepID=A0A1Z5K9I1_FISSO|nr:hypothetical protein FisN_14Hh231 [Fistulifera solaris]|eukprot:GAX22598.1 hypothetical protein FisN_14Hh231 [Fistulifera solaris]
MRKHACTLAVVLLAHNTYAFTSMKPHLTRNIHSTPRTTLLKAETSDDQIERLRSEAARLRAEAAALEARQAAEMAQAVEKVFQKFDTNKDGEISLAELKAGLENAFKLELSEDRVRKLMEAFDKSGDGALQLDEFVGVDRFRNKLDALARDERAKALEKAKIAKQEADVSRLLEAQVARINDGPPTPTDRIVSILPYLFPLMDGLQYASFLLLKNQDNPLAVLSLITYTLYRAIPFGGFIAFFALFYVAGKPEINRLVRFNTQQAIYLDIALFFPGLITGLFAILGGPVDPTLAEVTNDAIFFTLAAAILYSVGSSLLGIYPDKIPFISDAVANRIPPAEKIMKDNKDFLDMIIKNGGKLPKDLVGPNGDALEKKDEDKKK